MSRRTFQRVSVAWTAVRAELSAENRGPQDVSQAKPETHLWASRTTHRLRRVDGELKMSHKKVVLVNAAEPSLSFLI